MKISPITNVSGNAASQNMNNVSFNAKLRVLKDAHSAVPDSLERFTKVMDSFEKKLAENKEYSDDVVEVGESVSKSFTPAQYGYERSNLQLSLLDQTLDFFYNAKNSVEKIADDLYAAFDYINKNAHLRDSLMKPRTF